MSISNQNRKILWGRSGNRCAFPGCNKELHKIGGAGSSTVLGEECHIEAQNANGPRFNKNLTISQINSFENLILLCPTHHTTVDGNPQEYTVEVLRKMKADHEGRVRRALDDKTEFDDLYYESIVFYIDMMLDFDSWDAWTSFLLSSDGPMCTDEKLKDFDIIKQHILSRVWYGIYPELEEAIKSLRIIINDLETVFNKHAVFRNGEYITEKFYKIKPYNDTIANKLLREYYVHVFLVNNLVYEMTRTANRICDLTRRYIEPSYRLAEGKLTLYDKCPEYRNGEVYPGLEEFQKIYNSRDVYVPCER